MTNICKESPFGLVGLVSPFPCLGNALCENADIKWKDYKRYQEANSYRYVCRPERRRIQDYQEAGNGKCLRYSKVKLSKAETVAKRNEQINAKDERTSFARNQQVDRVSGIVHKDSKQSANL